MIDNYIKAVRTAQKNITLNENVTLAFSIGGSSIRCYVIDSEGNVNDDPLVKVDWTEYEGFVTSLSQAGHIDITFPNFNEIDFSDISNLKSGHLFSEYLTLRVASALGESNIPPSAIKSVGVCYAGVLDNGAINTNNIPIQLKDLIIHEDLPSILGALSIFPRSLILLNDSDASLKGELHSVHGGLKERTGGSMILGTGFNGAVVVDGIMIKKFSELGYTLHVIKENSEIELRSWEDIQKDPTLFDSASGRIIASPEGRDFFENHVAGVGLSVSFFEFIQSNQKSIALIKLIPDLNLAYEEFEKSKESSLFLKVKDLSEKKEKFDKANITLTKILNEESETEFGEVVKEFFSHTAVLLGKALLTLKNKSENQDLKFVFSGSIAENIKDIRFFWDIVERFACIKNGDLRVSEYSDGGVREAHAFTDGFQLPVILRINGTMQSIDKNDQFFNLYVDSHRFYPNDNFILSSQFLDFNVRNIPLPISEEEIKKTPSLYIPHVGHGGWVGENQARVEGIKEGLQDARGAIGKLKKINSFFEVPSIEAFINVVKDFSGGDTLSRIIDHLLASGYSVDFLNLLMQGRQIYNRVEKLDEAIKCSAFGELLQDFSDKHKKVLQ